VLTPLELLELEHWDSYSINAEYQTTKHVNAALPCSGLVLLVFYMRSKVSSTMTLSYENDTFAGYQQVSANRQWRFVSPAKQVAFLYATWDHATAGNPASGRVLGVRMQWIYQESFGTFDLEESIHSRDNTLYCASWNHSFSEKDEYTHIANDICIDSTRNRSKS